MQQQLTLPFVGADLITASQAARILERSAQLVRILADEGQLPHIRLGPDARRYFVRETVERLKVERDVQELLSGQKRRGPKPVQYVSRERQSA